MIHHYQVKVKGIDATFPLKHQKEHMLFKVGDCVWVKNSHKQCTLRYQVGLVTGISSPYAILADGMLYHLKNLCSIMSSIT